ncbi:MAG: ABC transporter ATP-binding protein [Bacteriovoracia bacterium]
MSLVARSISKAHHQAGNRIAVLEGLDLTVEPGETVAIVGKSGSGKSTLLSLLGGLDHPDAGEVWLSGKKLTGLSETDLALIRARHMGIIFQQFQLVQTLTALENVMLPAEILGDENVRTKAEALLDAVGLGARRHHFPHQLSGGEQQRVAIARALAGRPEVLLADEPTGNLDAETGLLVMDMLFRLARDNNAAVLLVTHDNELARRCARVLRLEKGSLHA